LLQFVGGFKGRPVPGDDAAAIVLRTAGDITASDLAWPDRHLPLIRTAIECFSQRHEEPTSG
jgi:hypothetical protein